MVRILGLRAGRCHNPVVNVPDLPHCNVRGCTPGWKQGNDIAYGRPSLIWVGLEKG